MPRHSKTTIIALAVLASVIGSMLHEGLGHGVTAWLRGDLVTEWTSNHLDSLRPDRLVDAGGTLVNLIAGFALYFAARAAGSRANLRYFLWILATLNLLHGAGYFLFSGALGLGDWAQVIAGLPHQGALRATMAATGAMLYVVFLRLLVIELRPFCPGRAEYNTVGRLPYYASCVFMCIAGALDPLGFKLMLLSTIPAFFGGLSGLLWGDVFLRGQRAPDEILTVRRSVGAEICAAVIGVVFLVTVARGIEFRH
ncbi:MAG TPA: hypothetical protein VG267_02585 [Terracidiphilus sp.]|jgi:hypothetical protein|nr:hypothetical protein [Terracidiphilus sp.]